MLRTGRTQPCPNGSSRTGNFSWWTWDRVIGGPVPRRRTWNKNSWLPHGGSTCPLWWTSVQQLKAAISSSQGIESCRRMRKWPWSSFSTCLCCSLYGRFFFSFVRLLLPRRWSSLQFRWTCHHFVCFLSLDASYAKPLSPTRGNPETTSRRRCFDKAGSLSHHRHCQGTCCTSRRCSRGFGTWRLAGDTALQLPARGSYCWLLV